jgi:hypothetical protein
MGENHHQDDPGRLPDALIKQILDAVQRYAMLGLVLGAVIVLGGVILVVLGFTGSVDITFQSGSAKGHIATGSLGIVVTIVGAIIVYFTKPRVDVTTTRVIRRGRRGRK